MPLKVETANLGVPMFVDAEADLSAKPEASIDSWYVNCLFRTGGQTIGFEWHQMVLDAKPGEKVSSTEFLLLNASQGVWLDHSDVAPVSSTVGARADRCRVSSRLGIFEGNREMLTLKAEADGSAVDVVLKPGRQTLSNGTVGFLPILGEGSYQYAFPSIDVSGTITLRGESFEISNASAWFDRQWGYNMNMGKLVPGDNTMAPSWLWLGLTLDANRTSAISLWDLIDIDGRHRCFATLLDASGVQSNHSAEVQYERIWKSRRTGNSYPGSFKLRIPTADIELVFDSLMREPEYYHGSKSINGCQAPCKVSGRFGPTQIKTVVIVEMIGDVAGESPTKQL